MITFDKIILIIKETIKPYHDEIHKIKPVIINRDLYGRIRLILSDSFEGEEEYQDILDKISKSLSEKLECHGFPADDLILFESPATLAALREGVPCFPLDDNGDVYVVDRLTSESDWGTIASQSSGAPRIVFFSIKGGVGRSTALAAAAWAFAQSGKRVLVLDLDLESPGLSSSLLPEAQQPAYGIVDWLVEDLVDNGDAVINDMVAISSLPHDGDIRVVPAHGKEPNEYIAKLGRVWMPKRASDGRREPWPQRLERLLQTLEERLAPDVILIDSRSGIDEVSSACVTALGARLVLLFAIESTQTWVGYRILFEHWKRTGAVHDIRKFLQLVGALTPEGQAGVEYLEGLLGQSSMLFSEHIYDEIPAGEIIGENFNFDESDEAAPHYPWSIRWNSGFSVVRSLHDRLDSVDQAQVKGVFGALIDGLARFVDQGESGGDH